MLDVHLGPFDPTTTLETGTTDARPLKMVVRQKSKRDAHWRSHGGTGDSNQRDHEDSRVTSPRAIRSPTQQPTHGACRCGHVPALRQERGKRVRRAADPCSSFALGPGSGRASGTGTRRNFSWSILQKPQEFQRNSKRDGTGLPPVLGCLLCVPISPQECALWQRFSVWPRDHQHHLSTTNGWPRPRASR